MTDDLLKMYKTALRTAVSQKHYRLDANVPDKRLHLLATVLGFDSWAKLCRAHNDKAGYYGPIGKKLQLLLGEHGPTIWKMLLIKAGYD